MSKKRLPLHFACLVGSFGLYNFCLWCLRVRFYRLNIEKRIFSRLFAMKSSKNYRLNGSFWRFSRLIPSQPRKMDLGRYDFMFWRRISSFHYRPKCKIFNWDGMVGELKRWKQPVWYRPKRKNFNWDGMNRNTYNQLIPSQTRKTHLGRYLSELELTNRSLNC